MTEAVKLKPKSAAHSSGLKPLEYKVLVKPSKADDTYKSKSGKFELIKPIETVERDKHASMEGEVIAISNSAFTYDPDAERPPIGATVVFARYCGTNVTGKDGEEYRLLNDKDIMAVRA